MEKQYRKYPLHIALIISVVSLMGLIILIFTDFFNLNAWSDFINSPNIAEYFIGLALILVGILFWIFCLRNIIIRPRKATLYLVKKDLDLCEFIDKKGKKYYAYDNNYDVGKYYYVMKTYDDIHAILSSSAETFYNKTINENKEVEEYVPNKNEEVEEYELNKNEEYELNKKVESSRPLLIVAVIIFLIVKLRPVISNLLQFDLSSDVGKIMIFLIVLIVGEACLLIKTFSNEEKRHKNRTIVNGSPDKNDFNIQSSNKSSELISNVDSTPLQPIQSTVGTGKKLYKAYVALFMLAAFGFLAWATWNNVKDGNYSFIFFIIPFWIMFICIGYIEFVYKKKNK